MIIHDKSRHTSDSFTLWNMSTKQKLKTVKLLLYKEKFNFEVKKKKTHITAEFCINMQVVVK